MGQGNSGNGEGHIESLCHEEAKGRKLLEEAVR